VVVNSFREVKGATGHPYSALCEASAVAYSSFLRWSTRVQNRELPIKTPGPQKEGQLDRKGLEKKIRSLKHGRKRTRGTGALYRQHKTAISRRQLAVLVDEIRRQINRERLAALRRITWLSSGLVWAVDDTQYSGRETPYLQLVQDLGSRHKLSALVADQLANGTQVRDHLIDLFETFGPPLFLKRDNGSNLNHHLVDELLEDAGVIPINSPTYYPPYNGGIERGIREVKDTVAGIVGPWARPSTGSLEVYAKSALGTLNHKPRSLLQGSTAVEAFNIGLKQAKTYNTEIRKEIKDRIGELEESLTAKMKGQGKKARATAKRIAAEQWLVKNGIISINTKNHVLPD